MASANLVISGDSVVLVRDGEELIDVVNQYQGQGVLNLLALDGVRGAGRRGRSLDAAPATADRRRRRGTVRRADPPPGRLAAG